MISFLERYKDVRLLNPVSGLTSLIGLKLSMRRVKLVNPEIGVRSAI